MWLGHAFRCAETGILRSSCRPLPTKRTLYSRFLQLPIPLGVDLLLTTLERVVEDYCWGV
jgi:hypothetical protein